MKPARWMRRGERRLVTGGAVVLVGLAAASALGMVVAARTGATLWSVRLAILAAGLGLSALILAARARELASRRILGDARRGRLLDALIRMPAIPVAVSALAADEEARAYASQILRVLREAGFPARSLRVKTPAADLAGADALLLVGHHDHRPPGIDSLLEALAMGGIRAVIHTSPHVPPGAVELFIGPRRSR